ncbi:MAG: hypothetical protein RL038_158, partial [Actinomycetota bacterium]
HLFEQADSVVLVSSSSSIATTSIATVFGSKANAPVIITDGKKLSGAARTEINRLQPKKIFVIGDKTEISDVVLTKLRSIAKQTFRKFGKTPNELAANLYKSEWITSKSEIVLVNLSGPYKYVLPALTYATTNGLLLYDAKSTPTLKPFALTDVATTAVGDRRAIPDSALAGYQTFSRINGAIATTTLALAKSSANPNAGILLTNSRLSTSQLEVISATSKLPVLAVSESGLNAAQKAWLEDRSDITKVFVATPSAQVSDLALTVVARFLNNRDATSELPEVPQPEMPAALAPATFAFSGAGLGHGIGMSQWGAFQLATEGKTAEEILMFYYTNSELGSAYSADDIYVSLQNRIPKVGLRVKPVDKGAVTMNIQAYRTVDGVEVSSRVSLTETDSVTVTYESANNKLKFKFTGNSDLSLPASDWVKINWSGTRFSGGDETPAIVQVAGTGESFVSTQTTTAGSWYRYGQIQLKAAAENSLPAGIQVVNRLRFNDEYLYGLGEVPSSWPAAALQAQVVAARSYAYYDLYKTSGTKPDGSPATDSRSSACFCHIYDDIRDQNFVGWSKISSAGGNLWKAAVDATIADTDFGQVVIHQNKVAQTFYSAANGGATQNNEDVWGGSALGYLRSVPDPGSIVAYDVVGRWSPRVRSQATVAAAFGLENVATLDFSDRLISGAVRTVTATSVSGLTSTITADQFRLRVKSESGATLGSNWFHRSEVKMDSRARFAASDILNDRMLEFTLLPSSTSKTAVLVPVVNSSDAATFAAAAAYAGIRGLAFVPVAASGDLARVRKLFSDRGITSFQALGGVDATLVAGLKQAGIDGLEISANNPAELANLLAERSGRSLNDGLVIADATATASLPMAVSVAVRTKKPLIFAEKTGFAAETAIWLNANKIQTATIVAAPVNIPDRVVAGMPNVNRLNTENLNAASRRSVWLGSGPVRYVAVSAASSDFQIGVIAAATGAPILYPNAANLGYLSNWVKRQPLLSTVINAGGENQFVIGIRQI